MCQPIVGHLPADWGLEDSTPRTRRKMIHETAWDGNIEVQADLAGMLVVRMANN